MLRLVLDGITAATLFQSIWGLSLPCPYFNSKISVTTINRLNLMHFVFVSRGPYPAVRNFHRLNVDRSAHPFKGKRLRTAYRTSSTAGMQHPAVFLRAYRSPVPPVPRQRESAEHLSRVWTVHQLCLSLPVDGGALNIASATVSSIAAALK
jgi:hypothetical protein